MSYCEKCDEKTHNPVTDTYIKELEDDLLEFDF
jgi:hypothetical protein